MIKPKKLEAYGEMLTIAEIARRSGQPAQRLRFRLNRGWSMDEAVNTGGLSRSAVGRMGKKKSCWTNKGS